jgi:indole-3-glycerol phosphate synthase
MTTGGTILDEIVSHKRQELEAARRAVPEARLREMIEAREVYRGFEEAVGKPNPLGINLIAEVKKASPSKGVFRDDFDPVAIAQAYERGGTDAISVLTDGKYFGGSLEHLAAIRRSGVGVPLLRKDFTLDAYHVVEAAAHGADALLLIATVLARGEIEALCETARALRLAPVVEVYDQDELAVAIETSCRIIQINNRDLRTFAVNLDVTRRLAARVPKGRVIISASGFDSAEAVKAAAEAGAHAVLVGESLMREADVQDKLRSLRG